jgi:hypothetical protein
VRLSERLSVYKISLGGCADFLFYLGHISGQMWFWNWSNSECCASNFVQILWKVQLRPWQWKREPCMGVWMACSDKGRLKKLRQVKNKFKSKIIIFFHNEFVLSGQIFNPSYYCDVLWRVRENVRRPYPELWRQKNLVLNHDSTQSHTSVFSREWVFSQKQHYGRLLPTLLSWLGPMWLLSVFHHFDAIGIIDA